MYRFKLFCFLFCLNWLVLIIFINKNTHSIQHHRFQCSAQCKVNIQIMDVHVFAPEMFSTDLSVRLLCVLSKCSVVFGMQCIISHLCFKK